MSTIIHPEGWAPARGYSHGVVAAGRACFIAGQIGWDPRAATPTLPEDFVGQFELALSNVLEVLAAAGGKPEQLTRLTIYVTDKREYLAALKACGSAWRKLLGRHYPAMALVQVVALLEDRAKVEIEATAMLD
jgi:enamine deaminase RidA (YjgF/YER057c/UK114 family)